MYPNKAIDVLNDESYFIQQDNCISQCSIAQFIAHNVPEPTVGIFADNDFSTGTHEWDVNRLVSYLTVSAELYTTK